MLFVEHGTGILQQILTRGQDSTDRIAEIVRRNLQQMDGVEPGTFADPRGQYRCPPRRSSVRSFYAVFPGTHLIAPHRSSRNSRLG